MRVNRSGLSLAVICLALHACIGSGNSEPDARVGTSGSGGIGGVGFPGGSGGFPFDSGFFPPIGGTGGFSSDGGRLDGFVLGCGFCPPLDPGVLPAPLPIPIESVVQPCCTSQGECGHVSPLLFMDCLPRDAPGFLDPACPSQSNGLLPLQGCCTFEGWCGLNVPELGLGCVRLSHFASSPFLSIDGTDVACLSFPEEDAGVDTVAIACERAIATGRCNPLATCTVEGRQLLCTCPSGYADLSAEGQQGQVCHDINECLGAPVCPEGRCVNTPGSYRCDPITP